jgi:hypothetical protein
MIRVDLFSAHLSEHILPGIVHLADGVSAHLVDLLPGPVLK